MPTAPQPPSGKDIQLFRSTVTAAQRGDWPRAYALAEQALSDGLEHPFLFKIRGSGRQEQGRFLEALADFDTALRETPDDFAALNAKGLVLGKLGRPAEALAAFDASLRLQPNFAPVHFNRGWALETMGDLRGAQTCYERALALDPAHAEALGASAVLAARGAAWAEARERAERALALKPDQPAAVLALALADLGEDRPEQAIEWLKPLAASPGLPVHEKSVAFSILGDAFARLKQPARAFALYTQANAGFRQTYQPAAGTPGGLAFVEALMRRFAAVPAEAWASRPAMTGAAAGPASGHAFLMGFPRSGTTLLGQILDSLPGAATLDEQETLLDAVPQWMLPEDGFQRLAQASAEELDYYRAAYWRRIAGFGVEAAGRFFIDKLPMNSLGLPIISRLFPEAKILVMHRDPRDVVLSCFRQRFELSPTTAEFLDLQSAARFYDRAMSLLQLYLDRLGFSPRIQRYEDLVTEFEQESQAICAYLGLPWSAALGDFARSYSADRIATPSGPQIARGLYGEGVGQWRDFADQLAPVLPILQPWVERFGYTAD